MGMNYPAAKLRGINFRNSLEIGLSFRLPAVGRHLMRNPVILVPCFLQEQRLDSCFRLPTAGRQE